MEKGRRAGTTSGRGSKSEGDSREDDIANVKSAQEPAGTQLLSEVAYHNCNAKNGHTSRCHSRRRFRRSSHLFCKDRCAETCNACVGPRKVRPAPDGSIGSIANNNRIYSADHTDSHLPAATAFCPSTLRRHQCYFPMILYDNPRYLSGCGIHH
jgi:hypothetical protein